MTFLAPIAGLVGAALVAPPLLFFYMLRLRRRPVRVSSTLLWDQAARDLQANVPLRWLRPSWLLLLQIAALAMLLMALARPAIPGGFGGAGRILIIVDSSASMAAPADTGPDVSRLEAAKESALELVRASGRGGDPIRIGVIEMAASARLLAAPTTDSGAVRRAIGSIEQTDQPADFGAALRLVAAQIATPLEEVEQSESTVVLYSDGALPAAPPETPRLRDAELRFVRVGPPAAAVGSNVGIVAASAVRDFSEPATVRIFARLINTGDRQIEAPVTIRFGDRAIKAATVPLPASVDGVPGEGALSETFDLIEGGVLLLTVERADLLGSDNVVGLGLPRAGAAEILVVSGGAPDPFLAQALEAAIGRNVSSVSIGGYEEQAREDNWARSFDLIVFDNARPRVPPPTPTLSFGAPPPGELVSLGEPSASIGRLTSWERTHPLLRHVSMDLLVAGSARYFVTPDESDPVAAGVRVLARARGGPVIAIIEQGAIRRAAVSFRPADSNWPAQIGFAVFIANCVANLAPGALGAAAESQTTAMPLEVAVSAGATQMEAVGPVTLRARVGEGASSVSFGAPPRTGLYEIRDGGNAQRLVPVNLLDALESSIATREEVDSPGGASPSLAAVQVQEREIWHWFLLAGFVLLTIEWLLYAWRMRL